MKKKLAILVFILILTTGTAFAVQDGFGIGIIGGGGYGWSGAGHYGGAISLKLPKMPVYWGVKFDLGDNGFWIGVTGDFIHLIDNRPLVPAVGLTWYIRAGLYGKVFIRDNNFALDAGARLPIGLSFQPIRLVEIFLDVAPSVGFGVSFNPTHLGIGGGIGGELGIRFWF
jgi:hypothetical protein